jgi:hypothetical protein
VARHDFKCPFCARVQTDINVPVTVGASNAVVLCTVCLDARMFPIPAIGRMDYGPSGGTGFKGFTIQEEIRGEVKEIRVDSLQDLRRVERESEQRSRNGEGRPLVWRDYNQGGSNRDVHTIAVGGNLGDPHGVAPVAAAAAKKSAPRRGDAVTKAHGTVTS